MRENFLKTLQITKQENITNYFNLLNEDEKNLLIDSCSGLNLNRLNFILNKNLNFKENLYVKKKKFWIKNKIENILNFKKDNYNKLYNEGLQIIAKEEIAFCLILNDENKESNFILNKIENEITLIEIYIKKLKRLSKLAKLIFSNSINNKSDLVPLYLINNNTNFEKINKFLKENNYFNYDPIICLKQEDSIILDKNGKITLKNKNKIYTKTNGSGSVINTLWKIGIIDHIKNSNIKYLHFNNMENLDIKICDPFKIGVFNENKNEILTTCYKYNEKYKFLNCNKIKLKNDVNINILENDSKNIDFIMPIDTFISVDFLYNNKKNFLKYEKDLHFKKITSNIYSQKNQLKKEAICYKLNFNLLDILNFSENIKIIEYNKEDALFINNSNINKSLIKYVNNLKNKCFLIR